MLPLDVALTEEAMERAADEIIETIKALRSLNVGPGGETFGTQHMSREDRMLAFMEDAQSGALDTLGVLNPEAARKYVAQYRRDVAASPVMNETASRLATAQVGGF